MSTRLLVNQTFCQNAENSAKTGACTTTFVSTTAVDGEYSVGIHCWEVSEPEKVLETYLMIKGHQELHNFIYSSTKSLGSLSFHSQQFLVRDKDEDFKFVWRRSYSTSDALVKSLSLFINTRDLPNKEADELKTIQKMVVPKWGVSFIPEESKVPEDLTVSNGRLIVQHIPLPSIVAAHTDVTVPVFTPVGPKFSGITLPPPRIQLKSFKEPIVT